LEITNTTKVKRALGFLFYDYSKEQDNFIKSLDTETKNNLEEIAKRGIHR